MIAVDVHTADLGKPREVSSVAEQLQILCTAIAHADRSAGFEARALLRLAHVLGGDNAEEGANLLIRAAAVAAAGAGLDIEQVTEALGDDMEVCEDAADEEPRTS